jgi:secreted trypsin-like serine protease
MHHLSIRLHHIITLGVLTLLLTSYLLAPTPSEAQSNRSSALQHPVQVPTLDLDLSPFESRIVGGTVATPHEYPWQVYLEIELGWTCGGSVIKAQYILTAAHCVTNYGVPVAASNIVVYAGLHDKRQLRATQVQRRTGSQLFVHGSYDSWTEDYDIAVIKLNAPLTLNKYVKTIRLAKGSESNLFSAGNDVVVSGWGTISSGGPDSNYLKKVTVDIVGRATCNRSNSYNGEITPRMLCAARTGKDSCQGDSGGPLFLRDGRMYKQVGVVSWGDGCAKPNFPGVYTHVGVLRNWVSTKVPALP